MFSLPVLYSDDDLLVVNKPPGLVVAPSETTSEKTLADILVTEFQIKLNRGGIAHRLDKDTSGILLVAKNEKALENLQFQFKERMVKKDYLALVHGFLEQPQKVVGEILRHPGNREKFVVKEQLRFTKDQNLIGRQSETDFQSLQKYLLPKEKFSEIFPNLNKNQTRKLNTIHYSNYTLVQCLPLTGRTHQIRVHLKYLGFPIVGDEKYGGRKVVRLDKKWCPRLFLHAAKIEFYHPKSGEKMSFEAPLPADLEKVMDNLEKTS